MKANQDRLREDFAALAQFNSSLDHGLTRLSYTEEYRQAQNYLGGEMEKAGLIVRLDPMGNLVGRREGIKPDLPAIAVGSHLDSVRNGGFYDGNVGIVCGLETARMLQENNIVLQHSFEVIAIAEEEGNTFGTGILGGKAISGMFDMDLLDRLRNDQGETLRQAMEDYGLEPKRIGEARRSRENMACFIEPHIEQGPVLESEGFSIGVVDTIVGIRTREFTITGRPDHGGTTPMHLRKDAVVEAASIVLLATRAAEELTDGTVVTCGNLQVNPGTANVVPGEVKLTVECRSCSQASIDHIFEKVAEALKVASSKGFEIKERTLMELAPTQLSEVITSALIKGLEDHHLPCRVLPSGAGHDSMCIAQVTDAGMVFIRSKDGRSHCPEEFSSIEDIADACNAVCSAVVRLDKELDR